MMAQTSKNTRISLQWPFGYHELGSMCRVVRRLSESLELNNPSQGLGVGCFMVLELYIEVTVG